MTLFLLFGIRFADNYIQVQGIGGEPEMTMMIKEIASVNLFVIWLIILGGFVVVRIVKKRFEDKI